MPWRFVQLCSYFYCFDIFTLAGFWNISIEYRYIFDFANLNESFVSKCVSFIGSLFKCRCALTWTVVRILFYKCHIFSLHYRSIHICVTVKVLGQQFLSETYGIYFQFYQCKCQYFKSVFVWFHISYQSVITHIVSTFVKI